MKKQFLFSLGIAFVLISCNSKTNTKKEIDIMNRITLDKHTYAIFEEARSTHIDIDVTIDFDNQTIYGEVLHQVEVNNADSIYFDVRQLDIKEVFVNGTKVNFSLGGEQQYVGSKLSVPLSNDSKEIKILYNTSKESDALLWLSPEQSAGKTHPFLFTQGQAVLTRTWIPLQDSPENKITYNAKVKVPKGLMAVMSADGNPTVSDSSGVYEFYLDQPIAPYLIAMSVGNLAFAPLGDRTGVYAEPIQIEECAYEFADVEKMVEVAEDLYGKYAWGRYDIIVLPPSFPFGGMENPKLTFATPTIIAGDRSLTSLIAHELAHSWSGNLVTNSTWDDFWLNEGFTVYFERRIMESLYGASYAEMLAELGQQDLQATLEEIANSEHPEDSKLKLDLEGRDPDDGMTDIAYEKGAFFLTSIERKVGREKFDTFIKKYFADYSFKSLTTEEFIDYLNANLLEEGKIDVNINGWVYSEGLPKEFQTVSAERFQVVEDQLAQYVSGTIPAMQIDTLDWTTHEWLHFLRHLPKETTVDQLNKLDATFGFTETGNSEIAFAWFMQNIQHENLTPVEGKLNDFLYEVGRRKFIKPLYQTLIETGYEDYAKSNFDQSKQNYHSVTALSVEELFTK